MTFLKSKTYFVLERQSSIHWSPAHFVTPQMPRSSSPVSWEVDVRRQSFPLCVVWCPIPVITHLFPPIGHLGICDSVGTIYDFLGPRFIHTGSLGFGDVARYWRLDPKQWPVQVRDEEPSPSSSTPSSDTGVTSHDLSVRRSIKFFESHENYNLFGNNCHQFVAHTMNLGQYGNKSDWNMIHLAVLVLFKGKWVSPYAFVKTWGAFILIAALTLAFQWQIFVGLLSVFFALVAWFVYYSFLLTNPRRKVFATPVGGGKREMQELQDVGGEGVGL